MTVQMCSVHKSIVRECRLMCYAESRLSSLANHVHGNHTLIPIASGAGLSMPVTCCTALRITHCNYLDKVLWLLSSVQLSQICHDAAKQMFNKRRVKPLNRNAVGASSAVMLSDLGKAVVKQRTPRYTDTNVRRKAGLIC